MISLPNQKWLKYESYQPANPKPIRSESALGKSIRRFLAAVSKFCFGWLISILQNSAHKRFEAQIHKHLEFLFKEYGGQFSDEEKLARKTAASEVIVAVGNVHLIFSISRGEFYVLAASIFRPKFSMAFERLTRGLVPRRTCPETYELKTFADVLRERLPQLQAALSEENVNSTLTHCIEEDNAALEAYAASLRKEGFEPVIWDVPIP